jgi:hypothetical protein
MRRLRSPLACGRYRQAREEPRAADSGRAELLPPPSVHLPPQPLRIQVRRGCPPPTPVPHRHLGDTPSLPHVSLLPQSLIEGMIHFPPHFVLRKGDPSWCTMRMRKTLRVDVNAMSKSNCIDYQRWMQTDLPWCCRPLLLTRWGQPQDLGQPPNQGPGGYEC